tara:strand:+ start:13118 stop:21373 length:8256 start_codon:yes stop_codon:yes gene_type:complete
MIEYKLESGKLVKVKPEHEQQFLQKYPTATLVSGNQESPAGGAPTGQETAAPVQEVVQPQNNTDSNLEVGSLGSLSKGVANSYSELENTNSKLEKLKSAMGDAQAFNNEVLYKSLSEEYNNTISVNEDNRVKYKNVAKQYKDLYRAEEAKKVKENKEATEEEANKLGHGFLSPLIHLARGFTSFAQGIGSITEGVETGVLEWWDEADLGFLKEPGEEWTTEKRKKARLAVKAERLATGLVAAAQGRGNLSSNALFSSIMAAPTMAALDAEIPEFDTNITQDFSNGDYLKAAHRTVDGFFASAPSFIAAMIPGGLALLAASTAGNKYEEEVLANPDMDTGTLLVNATGSGLIEAGFEYVTRGLLKKTGLIQTGGVAAAREYLEYSSKHILKKFGLAGWSMVKEGSSEAATELTSALWDSIPKDKGGLGKEMEFNDVFYRMSDAFIIGSFSGGVFESVGAMNSGSSKKNAEAVLMSEELKSVLSISNKKISELTADLDEATPEEKELIQEQIKAEAERVKSVHGRNSKILSTLKGKALRDYADNVDKINRVKKAHKEAKTDTGKELALNKYNQLTEANDVILKESIQSYTENSVSNMQEMASKLSESGGPSGTITTKTASEIEAMDMGFDKDEDGNTVLDKDGNKVKKSTIASKQYGTIIQQADGSYEIVINKDVPAIGVAGHEFFHAILFNTLGKDPKVAKALQEALDGHVNSLGGNQTAMRERLNESYEGSEDLSEETITIMSESILNGSLEYNEGFFTKIGDILRRFLQGKGIPGQDIKLDTGKDVFNFIKDFVHSVETGKVNKAIIKAGAKGAEGKLVDKAKAETKTEASNKDNKDSKTETKTKHSRSDAKIPIDKLGRVDSDGSDMTEAGMGNFLYQAEADQVVSKIKEEGYLDNLIAAQYKVRPVPRDFVQDVLAELTPHIKAFKPENNDSLFGWIQGQIFNKASQVYNNIYKNVGPAKTVDLGGLTSDGAPLVQIEADVSADMLRIDEIGLDSTELEQRSKLRRSMRLDGKMMQTVKDAVMKTFGTKLPDVNSKDFRKALEKAFRTELKKPLQDLMGTRSDFNLFLKNHYKAIIKALPVETLVQMERNLKPEHRIFTESRRITKPTEVDKLISQDKLPKDTSRTSGPQLHTKKEMPSVSKVMAYFRGENMEETLGYKVGGSTLGTRKDKLAMELGVELAFDATSEVLQDPSVQEKRQGILELQGIEQTDNELAIIAKQIDRDPSIKFSMSGAKKPDGYTGTMFKSDAKILVADIKQYGYDSVVTDSDDKETNKLVDGYESLNIPQFTVDAVVNWFATGNVETVSGIGFKAAIKKLATKFPKYASIINTYNKVGNLVKAKNDLKLLSRDAGVIANVLGEDIMNVIGWEILGYKNRILDPAKTKTGSRQVKVKDMNDSELLKLANALKLNIKESASRVDTIKTISEKLSKDYGSLFVNMPNKNPARFALKQMTNREIIMIAGMFKSPTIKVKVEAFQLSIGAGVVKYTAAKKGLIEAIENQRTNASSKEVNTILDVIIKTPNSGEFFSNLETQKKDVKGRESKLPKGLNLSDVNIMNINAPGVFKDIIKILNKSESREVKLELLKKIQPKIDAANKANILLAKHIATTIIELAHQGKISPISALHLLQSQTSIVNGFRGLSRLDLIDVRDGSQSVSENHSSYKSALDYYKNKGLSIAEAKVEALKKLGFKGEHLGPNSNTMVEIASLIFNPKADINKALNKAFRGHTQMLTSKYITDVIDDKGGRTNDTDFNRVKFLDKSDVGNIVSADNKSYMEVLANHEIGILLEDSFVDNSKATELQALKNQPVSVKYSKSNGMSTFDFDETLIIDGKNFVTATKDGKTVKIKSEDWPIKGPTLASEGYTFDFSDFAKVRGGKEGPLLQKMKNQIKKYGNKNVFVLTARQQDAAGPIHKWLKAQGINIPIENVTGLGKSEGSAKGEWMLQKFVEGYNDMYFVDDAMSNVDAVREVLDALDIKSKVVQAKIKFSKSASQDFNKILENSKGVRADVEISSAAAKLKGAKKGRFNFFVPPSAEDFEGLIYSFLGKGKQGEADLLWFKTNLFDPFASGIREMDSIKQTMTEEYKAIKKSFPTTIKGLNKKIAGTDFTLDNAIRVYLWKEAGFEIPGLSDKEINTLWSAIKADATNEAFANALSAISRSVDGYTKPSEFWVAETIASDLANIVNKVNRSQYLSEWIDNKNMVFSKDNLNKIEAIYGTNFREALENILFRMESGTNRPAGQDKVVNKFLNWINGSVGAVMFFNTRSAVLQTLSTVNFLNFEENNILAAAKAFANQKQFWSDFAMIYNSDMLKQRRAGLKIDVSASELTDAFSKGKSRPEAIIAYLLQIGFTPTQIADSFAISMGGSTFYRNNINRYLKDMSQAEAESQAFLDFQEIAEKTQQSSRPDFISQQQSGTLGRIILAWANTPMQMTRLTKKALSDLVNGRGSVKANVSKILYYGMVQNFIFGSLQTGLAFLAFGDEEDEEKTQTKEIRVANGMLDTLLRGTGVYGAAVSTVKNVVLKWREESAKGYGKKDWSRLVQEIVNLSPPIGTKIRKIMSAVKTYDYNDDVIKKMGPGINNPAWSVFGNVVEAVTNAPVARLINKANNIRQVLTDNMDMWQRAAILMGWSTWSVGVEDQEVVDAKADVKADRKKASKEKSKQKKADNKKKETKARTVRCSGIKSSGSRCSIQVETNAKSAKCTYHKSYKPNEGSDRDKDGIKEYQCKSKTGSGKRCKNRTENKSKKCYAHQ